MFTGSSLCMPWSDKQIDWPLESFGIFPPNSDVKVCFGQHSCCQKLSHLHHSIHIEIPFRSEVKQQIFIEPFKKTTAETKQRDFQMIFCLMSIIVGRYVSLLCPHSSGVSFQLRKIQVKSWFSILTPCSLYCS